MSLTGVFYPKSLGNAALQGWKFNIHSTHHLVACMGVNVCRQGGRGMKKEKVRREEMPAMEEPGYSHYAH